jgi:hypothetical protein
MRLLALIFLALAACAPPLPLEGAPCPCVSGWVCCPGINLCAQAADKCEQVLGPDVTPRSAEVGVTRTLQLASPAQGTAWEIEEGLIGGSVDASGLFFASPTPGLVHVIARTKLGATRIPITVRELRMSALAGSYGGAATLPIDGVGEEVRVASARDGVWAGGFYFFRDGPGTPTAAFRQGALRRFDPSTRRVETIFVETESSIDGPREQARFQVFNELTRGGPNALLVFEWECLREVAADTLAVRTVYCPPGPIVPGAPRAWSFASEGAALYAAYGNALVRFERDGGGPTVLFGDPVEAGSPDAGLLDRPLNLWVEDGGISFTDGAGQFARSLSLAEGTVRSLAEADPLRSFFRVLPTPPALRLNDPVMVLDNFGHLRVNDFVSFEDVSGVAATADALYLTTSVGIERAPYNGAPRQLVAGAQGSRGPVQDAVGASARLAFSNLDSFTTHGNVIFTSERLTRSIRSISRDGRVTTIFSGVEPTSIADETHVYGVFDQQVRRVSRSGRQWEPLAASLGASVRLLGALDDGRIAVLTDGVVRFIDGQTFTVRGERVDDFQTMLPFQLELLQLDPDGGIIFGSATSFVDSDPGGIFRLDLATGVRVQVAPPAPNSFNGARFVNSHVVGSRVYAVKSTVLPEAASVVMMYDPDVGGWTRYLGADELGSVRPGPLSTALLHAIGGLAHFPNGDLVLFDHAEATVLVVE